MPNTVDIILQKGSPDLPVTMEQIHNCVVENATGKSEAKIRVYIGDAGSWFIDQANEYEQIYLAYHPVYYFLTPQGICRTVVILETDRNKIYPKDR